MVLIDRLIVSGHTETIIVRVKPGYIPWVKP